MPFTRLSGISATGFYAFRTSHRHFGRWPLFLSHASLAFRSPAPYSCRTPHQHFGRRPPIPVARLTSIPAAGPLFLSHVSQVLRRHFSRVFPSLSSRLHAASNMMVPSRIANRPAAMVTTTPLRIQYQIFSPVFFSGGISSSAVVSPTTGTVGSTDCLLYTSDAADEL